MGQELLNRGVKPHGTLWGASALYKRKYHKTVIKAHLDYFRKVKKYLIGRDNNSKKENYYEITSVVFKYFVLGKKKFFTL